MEKGFTLFTALVGVLLIAIAMLLVAMMSNTEVNATEIIAEQRIDNEMLDIANVARADSLHQFNFALRSVIEEYYHQGDEDNFYTLTHDVWSDSMEDVANDFREKLNLRNAFAHFLEQKLVEKICDTGLVCSFKETPDYYIRVKKFDDVAEQKQALVTVVENSIASNGFVELIDCESEDDCENGSFYITLDLSEDALDQKEYEKLPKIEVIKKTSCRPCTDGVCNPNEDYENLCDKKINVPFLPRSKTRLLVPLRLFKGIAFAKNAAKKVFVDTGFEEELENAKLGVCDKSDTGYSCKPRTSFKTAESDGGFNIGNSKICIATRPEAEIAYDTGNERTSISFEGGTYNPLDSTDSSQKLKTAVLEEVIEKFDNHGLEGDTMIGTILEDGSIEPDFVLESIGFEVDARSFKSRENDLQLIGLGNVSFDSILNGDYTAGCSTLSSVDVEMVFREQNSVYSVNQNPDASSPDYNPFRFKIKIQKTGFLGASEFSDPLNVCTTIVTFVPLTGELTINCKAG